MKYFKDKEAEPVWGFEGFWKEIEALGLFPEGAVKLLPESLDDTVRAELMKRTPVEAVEVIMMVIDQVNHGSVAPVGELVLESLGIE